MREFPLPIAISVLMHDSNILLMERAKGDYVGLLGLPGGKVEKGEHVSDAAVREIFEETGIKSKFISHLGLVSEHLVENGAVIKHFLLNVCELAPESHSFVEGREGRLFWQPLGSLGSMKGKIIPSDFEMLNRMVLRKEKHYFECVLEKSGESYALRSFD